ncbi:MAG: flap endonuclease 1 [Candidatus Micrarchaeota archaeon]|nr:MAG: flap endonuclease 1 [Candidatus Micrarchaeota archaeon]
MSVDLSDIAIRKKIALEDLSGKTIAIDAYNAIYQFLTTIRQLDGTPLMNSKGEITSHLSGLFYRTIDLIYNNIKPIFVFDGVPPALKSNTIARRQQQKVLAEEEYEKAKELGDIESMYKYSKQAVRIDKYIIESSKELLRLMKVPIVDAPSEGEAEASFLVKKKKAYACATQDYDALLFGADIVVRNIAISGRRKLPRKNIYIKVEPELVDLNETLSKNGITQDQLIFIGILIGNDFNQGIKGIGPKTALKLARSMRSIDDLKAYLSSKGLQIDADPEDVYKIFKEPEVIDVDYTDLSFNVNDIDTQSLYEFMCNRNNFSEERVKKYIEMLKSKISKQNTLSKWM